MNSDTSNDLTRKIKDLVKGINYISETDAVIEVYNGGEPEIEEAYREFVADGKIKKKKKIEISDADNFFDRLTRPQEWHTEKRKREVKRFEKLKKLFEEKLKEPKLIRKGNVRIDIYVIGQCGDEILGIKTKAVET